MGNARENRRGFLKTAAVGAAAASLGTWSGVAAEAKSGVRDYQADVPFSLGLASFTTRKLSLDETIEILHKLDMKYVCLKSYHLPLDASDDVLKATRKKLADAGIELYGGGVIYMRSPEDIEQAFHYAKTAGMEMIVGSTLAELIPAVDKKIRETGVAVAIHNHGPGDQHFPTPESVYRKIEKCDKRFGLCIDVGHTLRVGADPVADIERFADRLLDLHLKDVSKADASGKTIIAGRGVLDLRGVLAALKKVGFSKRASFEYEADANDPRMGLAESVGYVRGLLATM